MPNHGFEQFGSCLFICYRLFNYVLVTFIHRNVYLVMLCQITIYVCLLFSVNPFNLITEDESIFSKSSIV